MATNFLGFIRVVAVEFFVELRRTVGVTNQ